MLLAAKSCVSTSYGDLPLMDWAVPGREGMAKLGLGRFRASRLLPKNWPSPSRF